MILSIEVAVSSLTCWMRLQSTNTHRRTPKTAFKQRKHFCLVKEPTSFVHEDMELFRDNNFFLLFLTSFQATCHFIRWILGERIEFCMLILAVFVFVSCLWRSNPAFLKWGRGGGGGTIIFIANKILHLVFKVGVGVHTLWSWEMMPKSECWINHFKKYVINIISFYQN